MDFLYGAVFGYALGLLTANGVRVNVASLFARIMPESPLRPVDTRADSKVFAATVSASIEPNHIPLMWKSRMRAFVFHAEVCNATARGLQKRIGLDRPRQMEYLKILRDAGLIRVKERSKSVWLTDWTTRHRAIATLPYPRNVEPPDFITLPAFADGTHSTQNRQD